MIILNTRDDVFFNDYPEFIRDKVLALLTLYECDSLTDYGSVIVMETSQETESLENTVIEFTEKIIGEKTVWWHLTVPKSNSVCYEIFLEQHIMNRVLLNECEANKERTVYDNEI